MKLKRSKPNQDAASRRRPKTRERARTYYYNQDESEVSAKASSGRPNSRTWLHNLPAYIAVMVIAGCLLYSLFLNTTPKIVIVNDQDTSVQPFLRSREAYQAIVSEQLSDSLLNRSKLTFNTEDVASQLKERLPETTDASITLPILGRNPVVYLRIAEPAFILTNKTESFVVDEQGRAVVTTKELPDKEFISSLVVVADESGVAVEVGKQAITRDQVTFIRSVEKLLKEKGIGAQKMVLPPLVNELHVYPGKEKYFVKYNFLLDVSEQTGKYLAVKRQLTKDNSKPKQYVDVRVEERVFVK